MKVKLFGLDKDDISFLRNLQEELKTQPHDSQAEPRYWAVAETKKIYGIDRDYGSDGCVLICKKINDEYMYDDDRFEDAKEYLIDNEYFTAEEMENVTDIETLCNFLEDEGYYCEWGYYKIEESLVSNQTGCFLAKSSCKRHIELNDYHYSNPHTYAMTAWRNPEFERVLKILEKLEIEEI